MKTLAHTSREFDRELRTLRERLLAMAGRTERQIARAVDALTRRNDALAGEVIAEEAKIDQDEVEIDELALLILARRQPVASDLRFVALALKIDTDIERIADLAVNIAKRVIELNQYPTLPIYSKVDAMAKEVMSALRQALDSFVNGDVDKAEQVIRNDKAIDTLNIEIIRDVIGSIPNDAQDVARLLAVSSTSRYLERIGDHATNIAEMVIYYVRGRDVRHHSNIAEGVSR